MRYLKILVADVFSITSECLSNLDNSLNNVKFFEDSVKSNSDKRMPKQLSKEKLCYLFRKCPCGRENNSLILSENNERKSEIAKLKANIHIQYFFCKKY